MATIISNENIKNHIVDKYDFKSLSNVNQEPTTQEESSDEFTSYTQPVLLSEGENVDSSELSTKSKESFIKSLMEQNDKITDNFIKLQMKLESKEEQYTQDLKLAKEEAFASGIESGKVEFSKSSKIELEANLVQFSSSVETLQESAKEFEVALMSIKSELMYASLEIAKEVVKVELTTSSNEIAQALSDELIKELQNATRVTLKVNPINHGAISEHTGTLSHIEVVSDSAIAIGGVIAMSDAGNVDAQVAKRFERVKKVVLSD